MTKTKKSSDRATAVFHGRTMAIEMMLRELMIRLSQLHPDPQGMLDSWQRDMSAMLLQAKQTLPAEEYAVVLHGSCTNAIADLFAKVGPMTREELKRQAVNRTGRAKGEA
jgi:hypothetical protein